MDMLHHSARAAAGPDREYGLDCHRPQTGPIQCITDPGRDPAAHFTFVDVRWRVLVL